MINKNTEYLEINDNARLIKTELWLAPILVILPIVVSIILISMWFLRGFSLGDSTHDGELFLGTIILFGNIIFDIPFIKSLKNIRKK